MSEEFYWNVEVDDSVAASQDSTILEYQENYADFYTEYCWTRGPLTLCLVGEGADRIRVKAYLYGVQVASATILKTRPCVGFKEGNDVAKIDVKVCAHFERRIVTAEGKICIGPICASFKQVIAQW